MHTRWIVVGLMVLGAGGAVGQAEAAAELKVGYVDLAKVFDSYRRTGESDQVLQQKSKQKQAELEGRVEELKKLRQSLELLNDQAREAKAREIEEKSDELKRLKSRSERELLGERNEMAKTILQEIGQTVAEYAKTNSFSVVLNQQMLLYGEEAYDVTDEVLKLLNDRYAANKGAKR
ncbi:MAG: OmpH family outer membrane protein [Candidatus Omnitrophica bacterium]|nr:OmpH family outer membrane protein [Candidatus Omnitrophota bacterium]